jgi:chromate transport protein ChrA
MQGVKMSLVTKGRVLVGIFAMLLAIETAITEPWVIVAMPFFLYYIYRAMKAS